MARVLSCWVFVLIAVTALPILAGAGEHETRAPKLNVCEKRCAGFEGTARHSCLRTCTRTMRRDEPTGTMPVKERIRECDEACVDFSGLELVRCRRRCLDGATMQRREAPAERPGDCLARCASMPQPLRQKCRDRCDGASRK